MYEEKAGTDFDLFEEKNGLQRKMIRWKDNIWNAIFNLLLRYCFQYAFHLQRIAAEPNVINTANNTVRMKAACQRFLPLQINTKQ